MCANYYKGVFFVTVLLAISNTVIAQDTLNQVLDRLKIQQTEHYRYKEVRHIELLEDPFYAGGELYISKRRMLIIQQTPTAVYTDITESQLRYISPSNEVRHTLVLKQPYAVPGMEAFLTLLYGSVSRTDLESRYQLAFAQKSGRWVLSMTPKAKSRIKRTRLSGPEGKAPDQLKILFKDEDTIKWDLSLVEQGANAQAGMQKALVLLDRQ